MLGYKADLENVFANTLGGGNHGSLRQRSAGAHDHRVVRHVVHGGAEV